MPPASRQDRPLCRGPTSGRTVAIDADTPVQTASVIKPNVLYEALQQIREGKANFEDNLTLTRRTPHL
jgi:beta-lactamase class A